MRIAKVSRKGQVTLPAEVRKFLNIQAGARIRFAIDAEGVRILPAEKGIESLRGALRAAGPQDLKAARHRAMEEVARERAEKTQPH